MPDGPMPVGWREAFRAADDVGDVRRGQAVRVQVQVLRPLDGWRLVFQRHATRPPVRIS